MVKNSKNAKYVNEEVIAYGVEARKHEGIAKRWIGVTVFCVVVGLCANAYFLYLEYVSILKIVPINVFFLTAISLSAGLSRFHNVIAEKRDAEALKLYALHNSDDAVKNKVKKAGSSKLRPSPARR